MSKTVPDHALFAMFQIGVMIQRINKISEKKFGLSIVQWCVLSRLIDRPSTNANSLALAVGIHPSTLTQTLRRLEKKRWIFITEDPKDSRKKLITITRSGKEALDENRSNMLRWSNALSDIEVDLKHILVFLSDGWNKKRSKDSKLRRRDLYKGQNT